MSKRDRALIGICGIALLGIAALSTARAATFDGTYTGERVLTKGEAASCQAEDAASVTIMGDVLTFTNSNAKDYLIAFDPRPDGTFVELSANIGGDVVDIRGRINGNVLDADVTSAHCQHHWHLEKS